MDESSCTHEDRSRWELSSPLIEKELGIKAQIFLCLDCDQLFEVHFTETRAE